MCRIEKNPIMISPYPIFEVNKLPHDPNTGNTWTPGIATHFLFLYDFIIIGNMLLIVFLQ
jgi:hypothetical protein